MLTPESAMLATVSSEGPTPAAYEALHELETLSGEIETVERQQARRRDRRDHLIRTAVEGGASERAAASSARVAPSWAHTAAKHGRTTRRALSARRAIEARRV